MFYSFVRGGTVSREQENTSLKLRPIDKLTCV